MGLKSAERPSIIPVNTWASGKLRNARPLDCSECQTLDYADLNRDTHRFVFQSLLDLGASQSLDKLAACLTVALNYVYAVFHAVMHYDRGKKFVSYQSVESFEEYLLVAQDRPYITHYVRHTDGAWVRTDIEGLDREVEHVTINCKLSSREIYALVEFPNSSD